jgi:hypothetical protein
MSNETPVTLEQCIAWLCQALQKLPPMDRHYNLGETAPIINAILSHLRASAAKGDEWQPIETAPKDGTRVILGWPGGGVRYGFYLDNSHTSGPWAGWRGPSMELPFPSPPPTHWQPLPAPPSAAPGEAKCGTCGGIDLVNALVDGPEHQQYQSCPDCAPGEAKCCDSGTCDYADAGNGTRCCVNCGHARASIKAKCPTCEDHPNGVMRPVEGVIRPVPCPDCAPSPEQQGAEQHIDLGAELWKSINEAATESPWIPPQYMALDWVSDVCQFLRTAPAPALGLTPEIRNAVDMAIYVLTCVARDGAYKPSVYRSEQWLNDIEALRSLLERVKP